MPSEIEYIETGMRETVVVTTKGRYKGFFEDLKRTKQMLVEYHFFQMHPRYFVNMEHIELIKSGELRLDNGDSCLLYTSHTCEGTKHIIEII